MVQLPFCSWCLIFNFGLVGLDGSPSYDIALTVAAPNLTVAWEEGRVSEAYV